MVIWWNPKNNLFHMRGRVRGVFAAEADVGEFVFAAEVFEALEFGRKRKEEEYGAISET